MIEKYAINTYKGNTDYPLTVTNEDLATRKVNEAHQFHMCTIPPTTSGAE
jgi:hypothetical protein